MGRGTVARRYAPLVALAAVQLLIIALVPSKVPLATIGRRYAPFLGLAVVVMLILVVIPRGTIGRRYAPLVALVAVQLLIVALVPSRASRGGTTLAGGSLGGGGLGVSNGGALTGAGAGGGALTGAGAGGGALSGAGAGGGALTGPAGGVAGAGTAGGQGGAATAVFGSGDTSHCVGAREFDPAIAYWAPPCAPGTPGATGLNNGGATYQGVTKDTVTIVDYITEYGQEVDTILKAEGLYVTPDDEKTLDRAWMNFINSHYVLYGRKINIIPYQGQCTSVPPNYSCLIPEMDKIVDTYHPYAVWWNTTLCSQCYAELARKGTVSFGGHGFSDEFANANSPFFYDDKESATRIETAFAQFYCNQLSSKNVPSRTVKFAGHQNPAQDFNGKPRVLGVISTNDPDNESTVKNVLYKQLHDLCGETVTHEYFYDQDINTAAKQVAAGIAAMDTPSNPATIVICLCDPVAPAFLYDGEQSNNYYPENVIATDQDMDLDTTGQSYGPNPDGSGSLGCPSPNVGCEYDNAFGLAIYGPWAPQGNDEGLRVFHAGGGTALPSSVSPINATLIAQEIIMMVNLIENTGPNLNPATMRARAPSLGSWGGGASPYALLGFAQNDWDWMQDARVVYWDRHLKSPYNGNPGTYVQIEGNRYNLGQYPVLTDGPPIPSPRP